MADFDEKVRNLRKHARRLEVVSNKGNFLEFHSSDNGSEECHSNTFVYQVFVRAFSSVSALTAIATEIVVASKAAEKSGR